jgi:sterol desaturase/sphingolipid hydroxylase (fatty acid hydroxylase superfamily)
MRGGGKVPSWLSGALVLGAFGALVWLERRRPLREERESKLRRSARNLAVAAAGAAALRLTEAPLAERLTALVERRGWGLLKLVRLPGWLEVAAAVVLLDYTLYLWHVLTHRVPWLWRFHVVHHIDLDLDATTALRFHFAELVISVPWRAAQILALGVSPLAFSVWQTLLMLSVLFHHSNVRLPVGLERRLNLFVVTPRMHGIHHSTVREETDSNWSSGLTVWDRLHGTLRLDVPQVAIDIGVPAYREPREVGLAAMLALPFGEERPTWRLDGTGPEPGRETLPPAPEPLPA